MVSKQWNEITKATYKNNLSDVKKELLKDVHNSDLMISMKIACIAGYTSIVKLLLHQFLHRNLTTLDDEGNTPLLCASIAVNLSIVDFLLNNGAEVNVKNRKGETPLLLACQSDRVEVINRLIEAKADMTACNNDGVNALMYACGDGTLNVVRMILNRTECNVNDVDTSKRSPLFHACSSLSPSYLYETLPIESKIVAILTGTSKSVWSKRHTGVTRFLINKKADINIVDDRGVTPLMLACRDKCEISVGLLLNDNAKINATDKINSSNALMWAMQRHPDIHMINIIKMLVHKGIDVNIIDANKNTSLIRACHKMNEMKSDSAIRNESRYYCVQIVDLFLRERVDVNAKNDSNETSLEVACKGNHVDIIEKLVQAGADLIRNLFPAFDAACKYGSFESIKTLSKLDKSDTLKSCNLLFRACGELHLESVCSYNCAKLIRFIIEKYGGVEEADNRGVTPLMLACQNNCSKAVELLVQHNTFINAVDKIGGSTALAWTLRWESNNDITTVIQILIKGNADADKSDNQGFTPLMMACERGNKEIVQILNYKVQYEEEENRPLQVTCQKSIEFLMENKQSTSEFTVPSQSVSKLTVDEMITAIADLVKYKRKEIEEKVRKTFKSKVENICFEHDAKASNNVEFGTNSDNEIGPLFKAFEVKNKIILELLIEANVEINKRNSRNVTPLMKACELEESYINILKMLVSKTDDINKRDKEGNTALSIVCKKKNPCLEMIKCLFDRQPQDIPDCTIGNNFGTTPLMSLCTRNSDENVDNIIEIIDFLINFLPTGGINQKVRKDKTYLMLTCKYGHYKIVEKLLKRGALINNECLTIATKRDNSEIYNLIHLKKI